FQQLWNLSGVTPTPRPAEPAAAYPEGTVIVEAESGTFIQPSGTQARPYGNPWAFDKLLASLFFKGAAVSFSNAPASNNLMVRYQAPPDGDIYVSVYVNNVLKASHVKLPAVDRTHQTTYRVLTIPVVVPSGSTVKFQINSNDDQTLNGVWDNVLLDNIGFVPGEGGEEENPPSEQAPDAYSGVWSMEGTMSGTPTYAGPNQSVILEAGHTYRFSAWLKGKGDIALVLQKGDWSGALSWNKHTASEEWTSIGDQIVVPEGASGTYHAQIADVDGSGVLATVYVDNVSISEEGGPNLLINADFEQGNIDWVAGGPFLIKDQTVHPLEGGFVDDDFSATLEKSGNIGIDSGNPSTFGGDTARLTRTSSDDGYVIYEADYDITSLSIPTYNWSDRKPSPLKAFVSVDGVDYTEVALETYNLTNPAAANWPLIVYEAYGISSGNRFLKVVMSNNGENGEGWATQVASITVNENTAAVQANPNPQKIDGPIQVALTSRTAGARIFYSLGGGQETEYSVPIEIAHTTHITAYAKKAGKLDSLKLTFSYTSPTDEIVDPFGQIKSASFAGKVTSEEQLKADLAADQDYYNSLTPPERDAYGGLPNSKEKYGLEANGFFHTQKLDGKSVMVDPLGNLYFSLGVNGIGYVGETYTQVAGREYAYEWLPTYEEGGEYETAYLDPNGNNFSFYVANRIRKTGEPFDQEAFYYESVDQIKKWGFTGEGAWSTENYGRAINFPSVAWLSLPDAPIPGSGLYDIFKPGLAANMSTAFAGLAARKDDQTLIGYMFGNELPFDQIKSKIPAAKASEVGSKQRLVDMLKLKYNGDIAAFNAAWVKSAASFDELYEQSLTVTTDAAVKDMDDYTQLYLDAYYGMIATAFREWDPNHMIIGDRWLAGVMNDDKLRGYLATAAGKYLDVLTYNYYTYDLNLDRLKTMYEQSGGKPMIFSEFHYGEPTQGLTFAARLAADEHEKGLMYRNYVEKAAASGYVVGTDWFAYLDQAPTGRWFQGLSGEAGAIGLLNVADHPYKDFLSSVMETNYSIYDLVLGNKQPYQYAFSPAQGERDSHKVLNIPQVTSPIVIDGLLDELWPESQRVELTDMDRVLGTSKLGVAADMRLAWDEENLNLYAHIIDSTPMTNVNTGDWIWDGDAVELFIGPENVDQGGSIQFKDTQLVLAGALKEGNGQYYWYNGAQQTPIDMAVVRDNDGQGYVIEAAIPLSSLNITDPEAGKAIRFDIGFDDASVKSRERQFFWNGVDGNAQNREKWGKAVLLGESPTAASVATDITTIVAPAKDATMLTLPSVLQGYTITIKSSSNPTVISLNGMISPPAEETSVDIVLEVTRTSDGSKAQTGTINVLVPARTTSNNGNSNDDGNGNGNNSSTNIRTVTLEQIKAAVSGNLASLSLEVGQQTLVIPATVFQTLAGKALQIHTGDVMINVPGEVITQLNEWIQAAGINGSAISFTADPLDAKSVDALKAQHPVGVSMQSAGGAYDFSFSVISADNKEHKMTEFVKPITLTFPYNKNVANPEILGVYYYNEEGLQWIYMGGDTNIDAGTLTVEVGHFSTFSVMEYDKSFSDVPKDVDFYEAVRVLAAKHIVSGLTELEFGADDDLTRAQFSVLLARALGLEAQGAAPFSDVYQNAWYAPAVAAMYETGIVSGRSASMFAPGDWISKQEMAVMIVRAYEYATGKWISKVEPFYADTDLISTWALNSVDAAAQIGLWEQAGSFHPNVSVTRGEAAQVLYRYLKLQ
ncbi:MAG: S-layer homology domain-containing protein, partial [Gorillibacterium sp.]|nr:S-layer homology domain-containing protein [Gorillibacterium sp.]